MFASGFKCKIAALIVVRNMNRRYLGYCYGKKLVTVIIPIHLEEPSELEKVSLTQTLTVLNKFPITFMTKEGINTSWYEEFCKGKATIHFERFKWQGAFEFSKLMINHEFYGRMRDYEFILICHLDAFVFRDELERWCHLDYDYIGSLIYNPTWYGSTRTLAVVGFTSPEYYVWWVSLKKLNPLQDYLQIQGTFIYTYVANRVSSRFSTTYL
jgi:hypothetical protein